MTRINGRRLMDADYRINGRGLMDLHVCGLMPVFYIRDDIYGLLLIFYAFVFSVYKY